MYIVHQPTIHCVTCEDISPKCLCEGTSKLKTDSYLIVASCKVEY